MPMNSVTCSLLWAAAGGRVEYLQPQEILLPRAYGTISSSLWLELLGPAAWQATSSLAVCQHACHRLLPWLRVPFALVPDTAWPGPEQWPWSTAPATGLAGRLCHPRASDPGGVVRCALSLCRSRCVCVCGVRGHLAPVHWSARRRCSARGVGGHLALVRWCARCVRLFSVLLMASSGNLSSSHFGFLSVVFFGALFFLCVLCIFFLSRFCLSSYVFFREKKMGMAAHAQCGDRIRQLVQQCSTAGFFVVVCIVIALSAVAPQGCGSRVLMYLGAR